MGRRVGFGRWSGAALPLALWAIEGAQDQYSGQRELMVREQLEVRGIRDAAVLRVMREVPRHLFVPAALRGLAYEDQPLPIGHGATISQPYVVALMTEALAVTKKHRVLEIGTGSGYQAAVLAQLASRVYSVEIEPELATSAAETLHRLGYDNVTVLPGDGYQGWPREAPFDRIIVTAAPPEIPQALLDQLAAGGRLVAPIGSWRSQELVLVEKGKDGKTRRRSLGPVAFVPMRTGAR
ncbi:MAG TPA: protein-L-isoaspartate(D-aspartate) O-methyltransferase [Bryobacteraceae bacterium]|nr:protein-L-isoaspartate(D-aspartate) O-methyltransferase [Bryobacteraceae bacterium]